MCIWNCNKEDRKCLFCSYRGGCEVRPIEYDMTLGQIGLGNKYVKIMNEIVGDDIRVPSKKMSVSWARNMVAYRLNQEGLSLSKIGIVLNRNHATILHAVRKCSEIFKYPSMYRDELSLWETFISNSNSNVKQN